MKSVLSVFVTIIVVSCVNASSFSGIDDIETSSNGIVYVSGTGVDNPGCGISNTSTCKTVAYAATLNTSPRELILLPGKYNEIVTVTIGLNQVLGITGQNQLNCSLAKTNAAIVLFSLSEANANLTIYNLTILLTSHTETLTFINSINTADAVLVNISSCRITLNDALNDIYGFSISISNSNATLAFVNCSAYNISCTNTPFIFSSKLKTLYMKDSTFSNIRNTNVNATGGCFHIEYTANLTLIRNVFSTCSSGNSGGVGFVVNLTASGSLIDTCTFTNSSAPNFGALQIRGDSYPTINIFNTSYIDCIANGTGENGDGGAMSLYSFIMPNITSCTFQGCQAQGAGGIGGALLIQTNVTATVNRCTFLNCGAHYGSAIHVHENSHVTLFNSVLLGNTYPGGYHLFVNTSSSISIENSFSDGVNNLFCEPGNSVCTGTLESKQNYDSANCSKTFDSFAPIEGYCTMPCAADNGLCVKPDECSTGYVSSIGLCVPTCSFWGPYPNFLNASLVCPSNCVVDESHGYPLCVIDCPHRIKNTSALFPCGSADCFYDSSAPAVPGQQCRRNCQQDYHHTGEHMDGVCSLLNCSQRRYNGSAVHLCGSSDCYFNPTARPLPGEQCVTTCQADNFHTGTIENETCVLRNCTDRTPQPGVANVTYPCGTHDCYYDPSQTAQAGKTCVPACASAHYREENSNATCVLRDCQYRQRNSTAVLPCAEASCFFDPSAQPMVGKECVRVCPPDDPHNGIGVNGTCPLKPCEERLRNTSIGSFYPCGSDDCFYDPAAPTEEGLQCISTCNADNVHSGNPVNGTCPLKTCIERIANLSASPPCGGVGGNCYYDPTAPTLAGMQCLENCTENHQLNGRQANMTCLLKACPNRLQNASTIYPCGTNDCYYDTQAQPIVGQQCGLGCDVSGYEPSSDGICVKKPEPVDKNAVKTESRSKTGMTLGIIALVLAVIALAAIVALIIYCCICGKKGGYDSVE